MSVPGVVGTFVAPGAGTYMVGAWTMATGHGALLGVGSDVFGAATVRLCAVRNDGGVEPAPAHPAMPASARKHKTFRGDDFTVSLLTR